MKPALKRLVLLSALTALFTLAASSCRQTLRGAGQDIGRVGDNIERATR